MIIFQNSLIFISLQWNIDMLQKRFVELNWTDGNFWQVVNCGFSSHWWFQVSWRGLFFYPVETIGIYFFFLVLYLAFNNNYGKHRELLHNILWGIWQLQIYADKVLLIMLFLSNSIPLKSSQDSWSFSVEWVYASLLVAWKGRTGKKG